MWLAHPNGPDSSPECQPAGHPDLDLEPEAKQLLDPPMDDSLPVQHQDGGEALLDSKLIS